MILIDAKGRYVDANEAALEMLGVSLAELLASSPDRFAIDPVNEEDRSAFRSEWETGGERPLVGTAGMRRADGELIRVSYAIEAIDGGFRARISRTEGLPSSPPVVMTVGQVLSEWRAAERNLAELAPNTPDWARMQTEIDLLRSRYQEIFRSMTGTDRTRSSA